jgi:hypothetical protein
MVCSRCPIPRFLTTLPAIAFPAIAVVVQAGDEIRSRRHFAEAFSSSAVPFRRKGRVSADGKELRNHYQTVTETNAHDFTVNEFPGADHGIYMAGTMQFAPGYLDTGYLDTMQEWLRLRYSSMD